MWRRVGLIAVVGAVAAAVGLPGFMALRHGTLRDLDDSDLALSSPRVDYADNGLSYLLEAADAVQWDAEQPELAERVAGVLAGDAASRKRARSLIRLNRAALSKVREALRAPHFRLPQALASPVQSPPEIPLQTDRLVDLLELRSTLALELGEWQNAFGDAHDIIRLAQRIESADGAVLTTTMMSVGYREQALAVIRRIGSRAPLGPKRARSWIGSLAPYRSDPIAWKRMWAAEYQIRKRLLEWISQQSQGRESAQLWDQSFEIAGTGRLRAPMARQPQRTLEVFADMTRSIQRASDKVCIEIGDLPDPSRRTRGGLSGSGRRSNALLVAISTPNYRNFLERRCEADSALAATQVLIALKAHHDHTGGLPESLHELVPAYLDAIPTDAFDGRPIRYDRASGRIYSIGSDGIDSGGGPPDTPRRFAEPSYSIDF